MTEEERKAANRVYQREYQRKWRETHREESRERQRKWRAENLEVARARDRAYNPVRMRKRRYGKDAEAKRQQLLVEQLGVCVICGGNRGIRPLGIDHDHKTKQIRGLLCSQCNTMLGMADDRPDLLRKAADYLEAHK